MITGEVKIREQEVVKWQAVADGPSIVPGRWDYSVVATGTHNGRTFKRTFTLPHDRNSGPMILTASIMYDLMDFLG